MSDEPVEVLIEGLGSEGAGVGRLPDGRVVFVHRTAPGERVSIRVTDAKKRWARGRLLEVLSPAAERREAPCPRYDRCGGCTLEHLGYEAQLEGKRRIVQDALQRIGGLDVAVPPVHPSPNEFRYRSRISLALRRLGEDRVVAGFHELERPDRIVDLGGECLLPEGDISEVWERIRGAWGPGARLLPAGRDLRLTLRSVTEGVVLLVEGGTGKGDLTALVERVDGLVSAWRTGPRGARHVAGLAHASERILDQEIQVEGAVFLQVNRGAAEILQRHVLRTVGEASGRKVVDAYCGVAVLGRVLAKGGADVLGIEVDPDAVRSFRAGAPSRMEILEGKVEDLLGTALPADLVLVNPPRTGLHERVPDRLRAGGAPRLVYVSCDPATLARDAARLTGGKGAPDASPGPAYEMVELECFDLFPQTAHVETVAVFERSPDGDAPPHRSPTPGETS